MNLIINKHPDWFRGPSSFLSIYKRGGRKFGSGSMSHFSYRSWGPDQPVECFDKVSGNYFILWDLHELLKLTKDPETIFALEGWLKNNPDAKSWYEYYISTKKLKRKTIGGHLVQGHYSQDIQSDKI